MTIKTILSSTLRSCYLCFDILQNEICFDVEIVIVFNLLSFPLKQVTYLTTTAQMKELDNDYGFTFKPTAFTFNKAIIKMVEFFGWKRAAVVYDFSKDGGLYVRVCFACCLYF